LEPWKYVYIKVWGEHTAENFGAGHLYSKHGCSGFLSKVGGHLQVNTTSQRKTTQFEYILTYYKHT